MGIVAGLVGAAAISAGGALASSALAPSPPGAPDYGQAAREAIAAQISYLPLQKQIEAAARLGTSVSYTDPLTGQAANADFTGIGDTEQALAALNAQLQGAGQVAGGNLSLQQKYDPQYIAQALANLDQADPTGTALRSQIGAKVSSDLALGTQLSPDMLDQVQQSTRAAQAARGNILGAAPAAAEAMQTGYAGQQLFQQRLANALQFFGGTPSPTAQFGQLPGAAAGPAPTNLIPITAGVTVNPNAAAQGAQFAQQSYGTQAGIWANQYANNPWSQFFGGVSGSALGLAQNYAVANWLNP
jgi:hypothetical protein